MRLLILLSLCLLTFQLSAQKIGYIDSQTLVESIPEVKEANSNIETFRNQLQKKGQDMIKNFQTKLASLEQKKGRGELSPLQLEEEAKKLGEEEQQIRQFDADSQQKIFEKSETLLKPLRDKIQKAIDEVAAAEGYDYIFDQSTGFVLYADKSTDIGDLVRIKLGL